ncbi:hypothetical protein V6760_05540 [Acinetobacter venetianus]
MSKMLKSSAVFIFIFIFSIFLYYSSLSGDYVWDDTLLFVNKINLVNEPLTWGLLSEPVLPGTTYFRPFVFLSWYTEFYLFGQNPFISHCVNLLLLIFNTFFVFILSLNIAKKLDLNKGFLLSFIACFLYMIHPAIIESTAWVSGRFDQFVTFFTLIGLIIFVKNYFNVQRRKITDFFVGLSFFLALLSKELGVIFPILLLVFSLMLEVDFKDSYILTLKKIVNRNITILMILMIFFLFYMFLRVSAMHSVYHQGINENYFYEVIFKDLTPLYALKFYISQFFLPFYNITPLHPIAEFNLNNIINKTIVLLFFGGVLSLISYFIIKKSRLVWLFVAALTTIILVIHIIPLTIANNLGHERFMTLGIAFGCIGVVFMPYAKVAERLNIKPKIINIILISVFVVWSLLAIITVKSVTPFWRTDFQLWSWMYKMHPNDPLSRYSYLYGAMSYQQYDLVIKYCEDYIKKHGALSVADQSVYASALMNVRNKDSIGYFQGVIYALPKFHEKNDRFGANSFLMTSLQMGGVYNNYANALVLFNGDAKAALENSKIAEWYLTYDQMQPVFYYRAAYLYILGNYDEAYHLYDLQENKNSMRKTIDRYSTYQIINTYCNESGGKSEPCIKLKSESRFVK